MNTTRMATLTILKMAVDGADYDALYQLRDGIPSTLPDAATIRGRATAAAARLKSEGMTSPKTHLSVRQDILAKVKELGADTFGQLAEDLVEAALGPQEPSRGVRKGTYTVKLPEGAVTLRVRRQLPTAKFAPGEWVIARLTGPNNDADYANVGFVQVRRGTGMVTLFKRYRNDQLLVRAVQALQEGPEAAGAVWARETQHCFRCGRHISQEQSLEDFLQDGLGPICRERVFGGR